MYLFERILLCCKEASSSKQKGRKQSQVQLDRKARPRLVLSGRIFMQNVTETVSVSKQGTKTAMLRYRSMLTETQDLILAKSSGRVTKQ